LVSSLLIKGIKMRSAFILLLAVAFLCANRCKSPTGPSVTDLAGSWNATQAEYVRISDPSIEVDIVAEGSTVEVTFTKDLRMLMYITNLGGRNWLAGGLWSSSGDVMTITWRFVYSGESQFKWSLDGNVLTLTGGHVTFEFTPGNPEDAILNLVLVRQYDPPPDSRRRP